jgi:hypothetical protein
MIETYSGADYGFYVIAIVVALIPLMIWAMADLDRRVKAWRLGRLTAQRQSSR